MVGLPLSVVGFLAPTRFLSSRLFSVSFHTIRKPRSITEAHSMIQQEYRCEMAHSRYLPRSILRLVFASIHIPPAIAGTGNWTSPNHTAADFSTSWNTGQTVTVSWGHLNNTVADLWLKAYALQSDLSGYHHEIAGKANTNTTQSCPLFLIATARGR